MPSHESSTHSPHVRWVHPRDRGEVLSNRRALPNSQVRVSIEDAADPALFRYGQAVRARRRERLLTQRDLADALGIARTSVANIEAGRVGVSVLGLITTATVLHMDPLELLRQTLGDAQ